MKKLLFTLFLFLSFYHSSAQTDEIINYAKGTNAVYYTAPGIDLQCARFEPVAPCTIKKINILLTGGIGTCRVRLFGYEAGDQTPDLLNDIIPPITVNKTISGNQSIAVTLPKPAKFDNSWFWVGIDSLTSGIMLLSDAVAVDSVPYGQYYYQAIHVPNADPTKEWGVGSYAYFINVLVTYETKISPKYLQDYTNGTGIMQEMIGPCITVGDYNNDGYQDLIINNKLYRNNQHYSFTDVTKELGIINNHNPNYTDTLGVTKGLCWSFVDINNDGQMDIVSFGYDTSVVFINDNGKFTEKILSLPPFHTYTYSALCFNWADLNNDGYPDLVAIQQASKYDANGPDILPSYVLMNNQKNDFVDESNRIYPPNHVFRRSSASQFGDFDNDGDLDLYVANYYLERDELYQNDGTGHFTDIAPQKKIDINKLGGSMHGRGVSMVDYDNDGNLDIMVARIAHSRFVKDYDHQGSALYHNTGPPDYNFTDLTNQYNDYPGQIAPCGLEYEDYHSGASFADVNNDGLLDLLLKTYNPYRFVSFYEQQPDHTFQMKRFEYGLDRIDPYGQGAVWADFNNDGKIDLIMLNQTKFSIYNNVMKSGNNSVEINLRSTTGNKFAIGGRATVYSGNQKFLREVICGQDEASQAPYTLHFGLGTITKIDSVVVLWPTKPQKKDVFLNLPVNNIYTLIEGGGRSSIPVGVQPVVTYNLISKVFPNPFKQNSIINYEVQNYSMVTLKIYDESGNEINTLVNEYKDKGEYESIFNAEGLPQGSYFYKLQIGNNIQSEKLILIK